jgi:hypothetical protein
MPFCRGVAKTNKEKKNALKTKVAKDFAGKG